MSLNVKLRLKNLIAKTFCDEIIDIKKPQEWWVEYRDIGKRMEGYIINVTYKYKGNRNLYSFIDADHFRLVTAKKAKKAAWDFYDEVCKKINAQKTR